MAFCQNQLATVTCRCGISEDMNLTIFDIYYPVFGDTRFSRGEATPTSIEFIFDFAVLFECRVSDFND